ncbi:hypothetical protein [Rhodalgimonas zhirmunskyi]|uniref:Lipoprotein n=1 Tax=Rhodalgimonas zhirmunskyi TaxID=2964767 RepID=A0AAJ1U7B7_9RHOB|nr:hypothetical protein [Rhodoalgimonas zhirmunskyi]MDQ2094289.1 hypothetical protein [Rhodoalgimonas zhirmunskyi]
MARTLPLLFAGLILSGCAQQPDQIAAVHIDDTTYSRQSCRALAEHELKQKQLLTALSADQKKAANGDALGVFLLGLPISSMSGSDKETEIAVAKGRIDAIERQKSRKGCK